MAGTASPGAPGPSVAPPPLPSGWIAQWDESTAKYYFVELGTGRSQWNVPTQPAPTAVGTPASIVNHPYGVPPSSSSNQAADGPRIITHPDGSQTVQHPDGRKEPILPGGPDGTRGGIDGTSGERGFGTFAQSALSSFGGKKPGDGGGSNPLGNLASSLLSGGGGGGHGGGGGVGNFGGKVASGLVSSLFSSGSGDKPPAPQNYHGGPQTAPHSSGGVAGMVMGGVANMFGGNQGKHNQNFGYSNPGFTGPYTGTAPPISYQPPSQPGTSPSPAGPQQQQHQQSQRQQPQHQQHHHHQQPQHQQPPHQQSQQHTPSFQHAPYGGSPQQPAYGGHQPQQQYYGAPPAHQYGHQQPSYGAPQGHYGGNPHY